MSDPLFPQMIRVTDEEGEWLYDNVATDIMFSGPQFDLLNPLLYPQAAERLLAHRAEVAG